MKRRSNKSVIVPEILEAWEEQEILRIIEERKDEPLCTWEEVFPEDKKK